MPFCIEGGDVLNLSESVLAVGLSQRTSPEAVELLSANMFSDPGCKIRTVLALDIPDIRASCTLIRCSLRWIPANS